MYKEETNNIKNITITYEIAEFVFVRVTTLPFNFQTVIPVFSHGVIVFSHGSIVF